jgi:mannose-6-phosphate isomerase-like protein (cupin superfamily)
MTSVEQIEIDGIVAAILVRAGYSEHGVNFFTPDSFSQQLAYMRHPSGKIIEPHVHNSVRREVFFTNEVLFLKKGRIRVDFYDQSRTYIDSRILEAGDVILLASGGHGFEILEEVEMIEVKQGPYAADMDKTRFIPNRKPKSLKE